MSDSLALDAAVRTIKTHGPSRVVINHDGEALSPRRARELHSITPDIVFIRHDGWTLGAPYYLARAAYLLWRDQWFGVFVLPNDEPMPIADWLTSHKEAG